MIPFVNFPFQVKNAGGGRGFENGVLVFDCPLCGDTKARAWVNVTRKTGGCFRADCEASGSRPLRVYLSLLENRGFITGADRRRILAAIGEERFYRNETPVVNTSRPWVRVHGAIEELLQKDIPHTWKAVSVAALKDFGFAAVRCQQGRGIFIPVTFGFEPCFYTIRFPGGSYMAAARGDSSHSKGQCLFGADLLPEGASVVVVESAQDAVAIMTNLGLASVALLGSYATAEQRQILLAKRPKRVVIALDNDAAGKSCQIMDEWRMYFMCEIRIGVFIGAKDAAAGGILRVI